MWLCEKPTQPGFVPHRAIQSRHERFPTLFVKDETRWIGESLLRLFAGAEQDEFRQVHTFTFGGNFDQRLFRDRGSQLKPAVATIETEVPRLIM